MSAGFLPLPVIEKGGEGQIPVGATGHKGTVTPAKVNLWMNDEKWADQNLGLRPHGWIGIDVDQYDDKHGAAQLAELEAGLGMLPATITGTARGQDSESRQHFYRIPNPAQLFRSKAAKDIDILQASHRFALVYPSWHPKTGTQYEWYDYEGQPLDGLPKPDDFEMLPEPWIEFLKADPVDEHRGHQGTVETWLETCEQGTPDARVHAFIRDLPTTDFGHDEMVRLAFRLVRLGAEGAAGIRQALDALYGAWLRDPYNTPDFRRDLTTALRGAITKAGAREEPAPDLLPAAQALGQFPVEHKTLLTEPGDNPASRRHTIIETALTAGLDTRTALSIVWNARAGREMHSTPHGLELLWRDVLRVSRSLNAEPEAHEAEVIQLHPEPAAPATGSRPQPVRLLSDAERERLGGEDGFWWGERYVEWCRARMTRVNMPYIRMNRWALLSLVFGTTAALYNDGVKMGLNLFLMPLGESSTGKTQSKELLREAIAACFNGEDNPNIGGDFSKESLTKVLIERDGLVSFLHRDEVDGLFRELQGTKGNWNEGLIQRWTELYEGRVEPIYRQGDKDASGIHAETSLTMHMMGVHSKVSDSIDARSWESGFMPRFVFGIGVPPDQERKGRRLNLATGERAREGDPMPQQWAAEFADTKVGLMRDFGTFPIPMDITPEANDRLQQFDDLLLGMVRGHRHRERLEPTQTRFFNSIAKCAALVALSEGTSTIDLRHMLIAIEQAEEWWACALYMVEATDETPFVRNVNRVERMIREARGQALDRRHIYRGMSPCGRREVDMYLDQLDAEGRILMETVDKGVAIVRLAPEGKVAA